MLLNWDASATATNFIEVKSKMGLLLDVMQFQFLSTVFVYKECADISYFDFDLKNTTMIL
jgi:hypothetical protein